MITEMFKEAFICGLGMIVDISGSHYAHAQLPHQTEQEWIASDWKRVGDFLTVSVAKERPQIQAEIARQLSLKLD
jgi:hypothetical protein